MVVSRMKEANCSIRPPWNSGSSAGRDMATSRAEGGHPPQPGRARPASREGAVRAPRGCRASRAIVPGLLASARRLPHDRGQLASRACAACRASGGCMPRASLASLERGLRALVASARCLASLERRQFALLAAARCMPLELRQFAARVPGACRARARILPRERALRAREAGLHPSHEFALPSSRVGEACLTRKWAASRARVGCLAARGWAASRARVRSLAARAWAASRARVCSLAARAWAALPRERGQPCRARVGCLAAREWATSRASVRSLAQDRWLPCRAIALPARDGAARWGACWARWCRDQSR